MARTTVGERDRARGNTVTRPRRDLEAEYRAREQRKSARKAAGKAPRLDEATTMDEAMEAERELGRREGQRKAPAKAPVVRYGKGPRVDAPKAATAAAKPARDVSRGTSSSGTIPGVTAPMILDVLIISADEIVNEHRAPVPSRLLVAFTIFGVLGMARGQGALPAKVFAWGIVAATFYSAAPGQKPAALTFLDALGEFLGGKSGTPAGAADSSATGGASTAAGGGSEANIGRSVGNGQRVS